MDNVKHDFYEGELIIYQNGDRYEIGKNQTNYRYRCIRILQ